MNAYRGPVNVRMIGEAQAGKTVQQVLLYEYLFGREGGPDRGDAVHLIAVNDLLLEAINDVRRGRWPRKTPPEGVELFRFTCRGCEISVRSDPGEKLHVGGVARPADLRDELAGDVVVAVVHGLKYSRAIAEKALFGMTSTLQRPQLGHKLVRAVEIACETCFGVGPDALRNENAIDYAEVLLWDDAVVAWEPTPTVSGGRFVVRLPDHDRRDPQPLEQALRNIAHLTARQKADVNTLREIVGGLPGVVSVVTHADLVPFVPGLSEADFDAVFDGLFKNELDRRRSQEVLARNVKLVLRPDDKHPVRLDEVDLTGARQLWRSILLALPRPEAAGARGGEGAAWLPTVRAAALHLPGALLLSLAAAALGGLLWSASPFVLLWMPWAVLAFGLLVLTEALRRGGVRLPRLAPAPKTAPAPVPAAAPPPAAAPIVNRIAAAAPVAQANGAH